MRYELSIVLESDMCMGNGEGRGNGIDRDICSDRNGLPYIPARRLKGCLRQTAIFLSECGYADKEDIRKLFGDAYGEEGKLTLDDARLENADTLEGLAEKLKTDKNKSYLKEITHPENIKQIFTAVRGQTKINEDGVKDDGSLRFTRVLLQYNELFGPEKKLTFISTVFISGKDDKLGRLLEACCKGTRHIGTSRNRGLGNVSIMARRADEQRIEAVHRKDFAPEAEKYYSMSYRIELDSAITLPGCDELNTSIPARSIIGCLAYAYPKDREGQEFTDLFLNGTVKWSAINPVIQGKLSYPAPMILIKEKNGGGKLVNIVAEKDDNWKGLKPKTLEGSFAAAYSDGEKKGYYIADVETHAQYHNAIEKKKLYMQDSVDGGYVYGGTVTFPGKYYKEIMELLLSARLRFGRSKNVQYSDSHLIAIDVPQEVAEEKRTVNENIYVVLKSDLLLNKGSVYITEAEEVRAEIASQLKIDAGHPEGRRDMLRYSVIGGFQNMWHLQKPQLPMVRAGSVYCFTGNGAELPSFIQIGGMKQEGFGLCEVLTESELSAYTDIREYSADRKGRKNSSEEAKAIENALVRMIVRRALMRYAMSFKGTGSMLEAERKRRKIKKEITLPLGRLRLMLSKSKNYDDFMKNIENFKTSDESSEVIGRKEASKIFMEEFFGAKDRIDWEKLLGQGEEGLYSALKADDTTFGSIKKTMWKLPLDIKLHELHYTKGGEK